MTRLPALEEQLLKAARRQQRAVGGGRRRLALLGVGAALAVSGVAAAASGVLETGDPVPARTDTDSFITPQPGSEQVLEVRVPDPAGGLPWGLLRYRDATTSATCLIAGRVQGDRIGVIGRDGVFADDGRFHPFGPTASLSGRCAGAGPSGGSAPPIPASGYSGASGTAIGGCREDVDLDGPTVSPQTARRLRGVPICAKDSLRVVKYGQAGESARSVSYANATSSQTVEVQPGTDGAYLFVFDTRPTGGGRRRLSATMKDGSTCAGTDGRGGELAFIQCLTGFEQRRLAQGTPAGPAAPSP